MTDLTYLSSLIPLLKSHGVKHIKMPDGLDISFHVEQDRQTMNDDKLGTLGNVGGLESSDSTQIIADTLKKQEEAMPPDLRADSLMDQDKILNWSSPDQMSNEQPLPLTGEEAL